MEEGEVSLVAHSREKLGNGLEIQQAALDQGHRSERDLVSQRPSLPQFPSGWLCPDQNFFIQVGSCSHPAI